MQIKSWPATFLFTHISPYFFPAQSTLIIFLFTAAASFVLSVHDATSVIDNAQILAQGINLLVLVCLLIFLSLSLKLFPTPYLLDIRYYIASLRVYT
jgi:hypothetical protein